MTSKAVVLVVPEDQAEEVSRLVASALSLNGYRHNGPSIIDWPVDTPPRVRFCHFCAHEEGTGSSYCNVAASHSHWFHP
jgi:hypothetical protein